MKYAHWFVGLTLVVIAVHAHAQAERPAAVSGASAQYVTQEQKVAQKKITFLEFGSKTCMPCKMMEPIVAEVRTEYPQVNVVFHNVQTEEGYAAAEEYRIVGIPTQVFLDKNGKEYSRHVGFFPKAEIEKVLAKGLEK